MATLKEHWSKHPITSGIISGVVLLVVPTIYSVILDSLKGVNVFSTLGNWIIVFFTFLNTPIQITVFTGLCMLIPMVSFLYLYIDSISSKSKKTSVIDSYQLVSDSLKEHREDKLQTYKADKIEGIIWRWDYTFNTLLNHLEIKHIAPVCPTPTCNNAILKYSSFSPEFGYYNFFCEKCKHSVPTYFHINQIEETIEERIKEKFGYSLSDTGVKITPTLS